MAKIILPPEENEETPQAPELNIDKPTENSKVITIEFEAKKTNKVSTKDTNQQLYTTDTDAWFEFKETSLEGANGTYSVVFRNRHDGSIFQRTGDVVNGIAYYKIPHQEIRHAGAWRGQLVYTLENGNTTAREFGYDVKGHILDGKDVREIVVEDFETLMSQLNSMKDNAEQELADLVNTAERNELERQQFYESLVEDINDLQENYQELLDTGVLQTNINEKLEALEEEYAPKLTEVTAQLAQKVGGAIKAEPENLSATTLGMITGNGGPVNLLSIPQDESVDAKKLSPKLTKPSYNILDESTIERTGYYRFSDGEHISSNGYGSTPLIPVKPNEEITVVKLAGQITYWEADGTTFIRGIDALNHGSDYHFTVPDLEGIAYVRISVGLGQLGTDSMMILKGHYDLEYLPYYRYGEMMPNSVSEFNKLTDDFRADLIKDITDAYDSDLNFIKPFKRVKNPIITKSIVTDRIDPRGVADPFIVMDKGRYHMFFEVLGGENPTTGAKTDEIGHAYSDNLTDWTYTEIVLSADDKGHRSAYPHVFKMDGEWYMLPDVVGNVKLYKATDFPLEWTFEADLLTGTFVDTNIFKIGSIWYMTTTALGSNGVSLYYNDSGDWKNSNWTLHPEGIIIPDTPEFGQHRGAGNHMIVDDCVYLPIQEVPAGKQYGYSTRLYKLANLSPTTAEAVDMGLLTIAQHNGDWNSTSMHHVSYAKYLDRKIFAVDGTGPLGLGYAIGLYVENYV